MDDAAVRETRRVLRQIQDHIIQSHLHLGATRESVGFVDVIRHPDSAISSLNYITPRKNTAWVSGKHIEQGLDFLREKGETPRVHFPEGLFPPMFARTLRELGLTVEHETPLMIYKPADHPNPFKMPPRPDGTTLTQVTDQHGVALWWYTWQNAHYDVQVMGVEPVFIGHEMREVSLGYHIDIIAFYYGFPRGVVRLTIYDQTAQINAIAFMKEARNEAMAILLHSAAVKAAIDRDCTLIFTSGETEADRDLCRKLGFVDSGSIVCYAERPDGTQEDSNEHLAQPVLIMR